MDIVRFTRNLMHMDRVLAQPIRHTHRFEQFNCRMVTLHMLEAPAPDIPTTAVVLDVIWERQISQISHHIIVVIMSTLGAHIMAVLHQTQQVDIELVMME